jgi:hypothetical protein
MGKGVAKDGLSTHRHDYEFGGRGSYILNVSFQFKIMIIQFLKQCFKDSTVEY